MTAVFVAASLAAGTSGCKSSGPKPREIGVSELASQMKSNEPPRLFDANGPSTRREYGVIPGAVLLESSSSYPLDVLPPNRAARLVFYCASSWCGAAETAARRALGAGYSSVNVLPAGIKGWAEAGFPVDRVQ